MQNTSHAVMSQRLEAADSPDDFPTPPWATRALMEYVLRGSLAVSDMSCLEPACGAGHMSNVLADYFRFVESSDIHDYGFGRTIDFFEYKNTADQFDWLITNPPFRLAEEFVLKGLSITRIGVAILALRTPLIFLPRAIAPIRAGSLPDPGISWMVLASCKKPCRNHATMDV